MASPSSRVLAVLAMGGLGMIAAALFWPGEAAGPASEAVMPEAPPARMPPRHAERPPAAATVERTPATRRLQGGAADVSGIARVALTVPSGAGPLPDASLFQRNIQQALAAGQPGKAGEAARHIEACQGMDRLGAGMRASLEARQQRAPSPANGEAMAQIDRLQAACQAVDTASRAQLVPLLRRSLAEGDKGAAAALVVALGPDFNPATEPDVMAGLTRDASTCDLPSEGVWNRQGMRPVSPDEFAALREMQRRPSNWLGLPAGSPAARAAFDSLKQRLGASPGADAVQIARLVGNVEPHCIDRS